MAYTVSANLYDGEDYYRHWDGGKFDTKEEAYKRWLDWYPPESEIRAAAAEAEADGMNPDYFEIEIGVWDEDGNDVYFWNEAI